MVIQICAYPPAAPLEAGEREEITAKWWNEESGGEWRRNEAPNGHGEGV